MSKASHRAASHKPQRGMNAHPVAGREGVSGAGSRVDAGCSVRARSSGPKAGARSRNSPVLPACERLLRAVVAQMVEHWTENPGVTGSSPVDGTKPPTHHAPVAQLE